MGVTLSAPIRSKWLQRRGDGNYMVATADMQGFRVEMEDALTAALSLSSKHPGQAFFGVYDGHGGSRCSKYLETAMVEAIGQLEGSALSAKSTRPSCCVFPLFPDPPPPHTC